MVYLIEMYGGMCTFEQLLQLYIYFLKDKEEKASAAECWRSARRKEEKNNNNLFILIGGA